MKDSGLQQCRFARFRGENLQAIIQTLSIQKEKVSWTAQVPLFISALGAAAFGVLTFSPVFRVLPHFDPGYPRLIKRAGAMRQPAGYELVLLAQI